VSHLRERAVFPIGPGTGTVAYHFSSERLENGAKERETRSEASSGKTRLKSLPPGSDLRQNRGRTLIDQYRM
jgi:hypothetical protein